MVKINEKMKKDTVQSFETIIKEKIIEIFKGISFLKLEIEQPLDFGSDIILKVNEGFTSYNMIVETKSSGEPRFIRSAIEQLRRNLSQYKNDYGLVAVPYITNDSAKICKENNVGYVDSAGNCFIAFNKIYIERTNYPNPNIEKRMLRSIFSNKASRILRVVLCNPKRLWKVQDLAQEADVSIGLAFKVKERLLDLEYAKEERKYIKLARPQELLANWAEKYSFRQNRIYDFFSSREIREIENELSKYCRDKNIGYALTLFSGAALVAPYARYIRGFAYVKNNREEIAKELALKKVESGANFTLIEPYDEGVFYGSREIDNMTIVSDIQLYLDLVSYKGRGEESAQFLFEQRIKPQW
jgi:hypothetical protein